MAGYGGNDPPTDVRQTSVIPFHQYPVAESVRLGRTIPVKEPHFQCGALPILHNSPNRWRKRRESNPHAAFTALRFERRPLPFRRTLPRRWRRKADLHHQTVSRHGFQGRSNHYSGIPPLKMAERAGFAPAWDISTPSR